MDVEIQLFGAFRKFGETLSVSIPEGSTVLTVKTALQEKLNGEQLVMDSVLANDNAILRDADIVSNDAKLSILPPVCGG